MTHNNESIHLFISMLHFIKRVYLKFLSIYQSISSHNGLDKHDNTIYQVVQYQHHSNLGKQSTWIVTQFPIPSK